MKTNLKLLAILLLMTSFYSCKKDQEITKEREYSKGRVYFEMRDETTLEEAQTLMLNIDKENFQLNGFKFTTQTSFDSLTYFFKVFDSLEYLHVFDIIYDQNSNEATFRNMGFENLSTSNSTNWETKLIENNITESCSSKKYGYLNIDNGTEEYWINELKNKDIINNADFVWIYEPWCQTGG